MTKIHFLEERFKKTAEILEEYFNIIYPEDLDKTKQLLLSTQMDISDRILSHKENEKLVSKLKPIFRALVIERNNIAKNEGFDNYVDFIFHQDGIPQKSMRSFLKTAKKAVSKINKNLSIPPDVPDWYWSKFNIPCYLQFVEHNNNFVLPKDAYKILLHKKPRFKKLISKIEIANQEGFFPKAVFDSKNKTAIIEIDKNNTDIHNLLEFIHEVGHAVSFLELSQKGIDPKTKPRYWNEEQAIQTVLKFEKSLPIKIKNACIGEFLGDFAAAFFEYGIYNNPNQDFDRAYAKSINRVFLMCKQKENPYYVLEKEFILKPCTSFATCIAICKYYTST